MKLSVFRGVFVVQVVLCLWVASYLLQEPRRQETKALFSALPIEIVPPMRRISLPVASPPLRRYRLQEQTKTKARQKSPVLQRPSVLLPSQKEAPQLPIFSRVTPHNLRQRQRRQLFESKEEDTENSASFSLPQRIGSTTSKRKAYRPRRFTNIEERTDKASESMAIPRQKRRDIVKSLASLRRRIHSLFFDSKNFRRGWQQGNIKVKNESQYYIVFLNDQWVAKVYQKKIVWNNQTEAKQKEILSFLINYWNR